MKRALALLIALHAGAALAQQTDQYGRSIACTGNGLYTCTSPDGVAVQAASIAAALRAFAGMAPASYVPPAPSAPPPAPITSLSLSGMNVTGTRSDGTTSQVSLSSVVPTPLTTTPPAAAPTGAAGTAGSYVPGNAVPPSLVRAVNVTTASDGTFSVTLSPAMISATPGVLFGVGNSGSQPIECNWTSRSATTVAGKCWQAATFTVSILGATVNVFPSGASGVQITVFAREPTQ